ncbi:MAG TPA: ATP-binding protein [Bryobacteraceae bacterium]|nr:ATP-binding protein [Bryobacteraceae bacterium]
MRTSAWPLLIAGLSAMPVLAQTVRPMPIAEAIRNRPDRSAAHNGETIAITGVITDGSHDVGSGSSLANVQDAGGGIALFGSHAVLPPEAFRRGDVVEARGKLSQYRGMEELLLQEIHRTATARVPAPLDVSAAQVAGEEFSGRLVRVKGKLIVGPKGDVALRDGTGEIPVYLFHSFFQNTSFMQRLLEGGPAEITGLARQRVEPGQPPNSGYLLSPRDEQDFHFGPLPKYRQMAAGGLVLLGAFLYLWLRRNAAEKRARKLAALSAGLKESEERFRQMAASIYQIFWMLDVKTNRILYVSPSFEEVWGRRPEIFAQRSGLLDTVHPDDRARVSEYLTKSAMEASKETYRIVRPDGSVRWILDRAFPVFDAHGKLYRITGTLEDITDRRALEEQLRQAQKMEAVGRLAGGIAHDFNNVLTVVSGYLHMVLDVTPPGDPRHEKLKQILAAANRATTLTSQLLAFGRKQMVQPKLVDVNHLVGNMERLLRRVMGEHIRLETEFGSPLPFVKADPNQLEQVLINLAANARDAMPEGGEFRIRTLREGSLVRMEISDTGCGMSPDVVEHVFEPFFTTKEVGRGTGLGLSSVYGIIQQNGGTITVSSSPGRGTMFIVLLPAAEEAEMDESKAAAAFGSLRGTETILVAEDEPAVRTLVCGMLEQLGYTVLQAADGHEALRILERQGHVDLLLTDAIMPVMSGRELARRVGHRTKVLYMSGYTDDTLAFHGLPQAGADYLQKPFTAEALGAKVRQVLAAPETGRAAAGLS